MTLYLLKFNPYSNRQVKGYAGLSSYQPYIQSSHTNINFNPNDGVDTEIVLNTETDGCDYAVLTDDLGTIISRWFVLDGARTRVGQYKYTLRRDVIYDHLDEIKLSTAYIVKGWCNTNNSSIYNKEQFECNQIKTYERLLKDKTETPWIVGYISPTDESTTVEWNINYTATSITETEYNILSSPQSKLYDSYTNLVINCPSTGTLPGGKKAVIHFNKNGRLSTTGTSEIIVADWRTKADVGGLVNINDCDVLADQLSRLYTSYFEAIVTAQVESQYTNKYDSFRQYADKVVAYDGKYYKVHYIATTEAVDQTLENTSDIVIRIYNALRLSNLVQQKPISHSGVPTNLTYTTIYFRPVIEEIVNKYSATIPNKDTILKLNNQPYAMFAMPYQNYKSIGLSEGVVINQGPASSAIAQAISSTFSGSNALYDLQLVPYCPLLDYVESINNGETFMNLDKMPVGSYTDITYTSGQDTSTVGYIYWCTKDTFSFDIPFVSTISNDPIIFKTMQQTGFYRLCSPNYSGVFEFRPTANNGVRRINVDCTYKPYSPYIHLNPEFAGLYGNDFNDARGLICGGDFSLPQITDAWQTYQIQNKNYDNSFNREVQSIEVQNKYALGSDIAQAVFGSGQGGMTGGAIGSTFGLTAVGAIAGAGLSAGGGTADIIINNQLRKEQLDLKKDLYVYNIQNIKALPNTLSKVGALNANNKLFPFIETYKCLEDETIAFHNKVLYNGFTINKIGKIFEYSADQLEKDTYGFDYWFLQCQLIRTDMHEDWHMIRTIKDELEMGVFI